MAKTTIGRVRPTYVGDWDSTKAYKILDRVTYGMVLWEAIKDVPALQNAPSKTSTYWYAISAQDVESVDTSDLVHKSQTETITGIKTFNASPLVPTALSGDISKKAANTEFVDDAITASATTLQNNLNNEVSTITTNINTLTTNIATALADKADDNAVVHLSGNEIIEGEKNFHGVVKGTTPPTNDNSERMATTQFVQNVANQIQAGNINTDLLVTTDKSQLISGIKTFTQSPVVPTPNAEDNSQKVANTEFVQSTIDAKLADYDISDVVHDNGNETISGIKTFTDSPLVPTPAITDKSDKTANTHFVGDAITQTKTNLGFDADDILSKEHGGTGRDDGVSQDVVIAGANGSILAKSVGQIGQAKVISTGTNIDSVIDRGLYILQKNMTVADNLPESSGAISTFLQVFQQGNYIVQRWEYITRVWQRRSTNRGESWQAWYPVGGFKGSLTIYISKSGSDSNTGLFSGWPVLTFDRAFQIADILARGSYGISVYFRVGAGEWNNLTIADKPYTIIIQPYDGQVPTEYSTSLPVFRDLQSYNSRITVTGLVIGYLRVYDRGKIIISTGYKRIAWMQATNGGEIIFNTDYSETNILEINNNDVSSITRAGFLVGTKGYIQVNNTNIKYTFNGSYDSFLWVAESAEFFWHSAISINSSATFNNKKYTILSGGFVNNELNVVGKPIFLDNLPGTQAGVDYPGSIYNGIPKGLLDKVST